MLRLTLMAAAMTIGAVTSLAAAVGTNIVWTSVTCAATSTSFGLPTPGPIYLSVQVPPSAMQNVCFGWGQNAATLNPPSQCYGAGTVIEFQKGGTGSCIVSSGTQAITVGYQ